MNRLPPLPLRGIPRALFLAFLAFTAMATSAFCGLAAAGLLYLTTP